MATSLLERGLELENTVSEAQKEHEAGISKNYQKLIGDESSAQKYYASNAVDTPSRYSYNNYAPKQETREYRAPERQTNAVPSAAQRIADYVPITVGMKKLQRFGDMPSYSSERVVDYAPVIEATPAREATQTRAPLFEGIEFRDGQVVDAYVPTYTPVEEKVQAPEQETIYTPSEDDSLPSRETMDTIRRMREMENVEQKVGFFSALSAKTKLALCAVAAAVVVMIVAVCINTAILNSLSANVQARQAQLAQLSERSQNIQMQLDEIKDPQNIANWAIEQGMTK